MKMLNVKVVKRKNLGKISIFERAKFAFAADFFSGDLRIWVENLVFIEMLWIPLNFEKTEILSILIKFAELSIFCRKIK